MFAAAGIAATGAVGIWLGTIAFFSFVVAPRAFAVLGEDAAGELVNAVFPTYYTVGATLGIVAVAAGVARSLLGDFGLYLGLYLATLVLSIFVATLSRVYLIPRIEDAEESEDEDAFDKYHDLSVKLNSVMLVSVTAALVFWHV